MTALSIAADLHRKVGNVAPWPKTVIPSYPGYYASSMVQSTHNKRLQFDSAMPGDWGEASGNLW